MLKPERYELILKLVNEKGIVSNDDLCNMLKVSKATIRRDLEQLNEDKLLKRTHGGAVAFSKPTSADVPITIRQRMQKSEKSRIGAAAVEFVKEGDTIYIGAGTTTLEFAARLNMFHQLTILTNDIGVAYEIANNTDNDLIVTGGMLKKLTKTLTGLFSEQTLKELYVDTAFMAVDAVDINKGLMDYNTDEALIKRMMIKNSRYCVMLVDHSKFQNYAFMSICPISEVDAIITNGEISPDFTKRLNDEGVRLLTV